MKKILILFCALFIASIVKGQTAVEYFERGLSKYKSGNYSEAIAYYTLAIKLDPNYVAAFINRAIAKAVYEDEIGAIPDFNKAIELDPKNAEAYKIRGLTKIKLGQKDSGCLDLSKGGELGDVEAYGLISKNCQ
jgi:tetratricopeptide (TPR) repeat protein